MLTVHYKNLQGLDTESTPVTAPQLAFLRLVNYHLNRERGALVKRGGTKRYNMLGDTWGIGGFPQPTASLKVPIKDIIIRHRYYQNASAIERLNLDTGEFEEYDLGASTSFSIAAVSDIFPANDIAVILGGRPAMIRDAENGPVARLGGPYPASAPSLTTQAGSLTATNYTYVYTFYDPTTGWESSPSAVSATVSPTSEDVVCTMATECDKEGVTKKRLYRTIDNGELPHRLIDADIDLATATYTDDTADGDLSLTAAPSSLDHDPPPDTVFVGAFHQNRLWLVSGNEVWYSLPDDGTGVPVQYFSPNRVERFRTQVTALGRSPSGGLFVFSPPGFGISEIRGRTDSEFYVVEAYRKEGCHFHQSVAHGGRDDNLITFWGANGPTFIGPDGLHSKDAAKVWNLIRGAMTEGYNQAAFAWTCYDQGNHQFLFGLALQSIGESMWQIRDTGITVAWRDRVTGQRIRWEPRS